jgi:hypothetical protein
LNTLISKRFLTNAGFVGVTIDFTFVFLVNELIRLTRLLASTSFAFRVNSESNDFLNDWTKVGLKGVTLPIMFLEGDFVTRLQPTVSLPLKVDFRDESIRGD